MLKDPLWLQWFTVFDCSVFYHRWLLTPHSELLGSGHKRSTTTSFWSLVSTGDSIRAGHVCVGRSYRWVFLFGIDICIAGVWESTHCLSIIPLLPCIQPALHSLLSTHMAPEAPGRDSATECTLLVVIISWWNKNVRIFIYASCQHNTTWNIKVIKSRFGAWSPLNCSLMRALCWFIIALLHKMKDIIILIHIPLPLCQCYPQYNLTPKSSVRGVSC